MIFEIDKAYTPETLISAGFWQLWVVLAIVMVVIGYKGYHKNDEDWSFKSPLMKFIGGLCVTAVLISAGVGAYDNYQANKTMAKRALEIHAAYSYGMEEFVIHENALEGKVSFKKRFENKEGTGEFQRVSDNEWVLKDSKGNEIKPVVTMLKPGEKKQYEDVPSISEIVKMSNKNSEGGN